MNKICLSVNKTSKKQHNNATNLIIMNLKHLEKSLKLQVSSISSRYLKIYPLNDKLQKRNSQISSKKRNQ